MDFPKPTAQTANIFKDYKDKVSFLPPQKKATRAVKIKLNSEGSHLKASGTSMQPEATRPKQLI